MCNVYLLFMVVCPGSIVYWLLTTVYRLLSLQQDLQTLQYMWQYRYMWHGAETKRHYVLTSQDTLGVISLTNKESSGLSPRTIQHRDQTICAFQLDV